MTLRRIISANISGATTLRLSFEDGSTGSIDLKPMIDAGGVFSPLQDGAALRQVRIGPAGRSLQWPTGADLCADVLWQQAHRHGDIAV